MKITNFGLEIRFRHDVYAVVELVLEGVLSITKVCVLAADSRPLNSWTATSAERQIATHVMQTRVHMKAEALPG